MSEAAAEAAGTEQAKPAPIGTEQPAADAPPWGSDEEFNPEKAWNLIQNLRTDNTELKSKSSEASARLQEIEDAKLTESEKLTRDLETTRTENGSLSLENARLKAVLAHDALTIDDLALIGGTTAEEVEEAAAKLAARLGTGAPTPPPSARPQAALRGGGDPTVATEPTDWLRSALSKSNQ